MPAIVSRSSRIRPTLTRPLAVRYFNRRGNDSLLKRVFKLINLSNQRANQRAKHQFDNLPKGNNSFHFRLGRWNYLKRIDPFRGRTDYSSSLDRKVISYFCHRHYPSDKKVAILFKTHLSTANSKPEKWMGPFPSRRYSRIRHKWAQYIWIYSRHFWFSLKYIYVMIHFYDSYFMKNSFACWYSGNWRSVIEVFWFGGIGFGFLSSPNWSILGQDCL